MPRALHEQERAHRSRAAVKASAKEKVADAAFKWWVNKRPAGWSRQGHILDPSIGCKSVFEVTLAMAVAEYSKHLD